MSQPSSHGPGPVRPSSRAPFASRPDFGAVGSILDNRYRIEHVIGEGGMGVVVRALDLRLDRTVAIKLLHSEYADQEDVLERFAREATVIAKLRSRYVVSVLDVSTDREKPYLVLEYLEGESLEDRIFRDGPLPIGEAVRYARQVAEALEEAHGAGILHRDIKPANVFLTRQPNHEIVAQILDFGTARFYDARRQGQLSKPTITKQYETFGSPAYMPPEQISSARNTDERSDVWALGTVLYEAVTGRLAFEGEYPEVFVVISTREPPTLRSLRPEAPAELETIIERCLRKTKEDRYTSMTELKRALLSLEQEILPSRSRPNYTVPSPPMSAGTLPSSIAGYDGPQTQLDQAAGLVLAPTPSVPFPVYNALSSTGSGDVVTPAVAMVDLQDPTPSLRRSVPQFDDAETQFDLQPAGTEPSPNRKLLWFGIVGALCVALLLLGVRFVHGTDEPHDPEHTTSTAPVASTNVPPPEPVVVKTAPTEVTPTAPPVASAAAPVAAIPSAPHPTAIKPTGGKPVTPQAAVPAAPQTSGNSGKTSPALPSEPKTPSGDPLGRRK